MSSDASGDLAGVSDFAHLHLHSQYSLLDGAIRTQDLCAAVRDRGMKAVAVTDHGNMFGALQFYGEAKKHGIKPIFGCEAYISDGPMRTKVDRKNYHLVLLAESTVGFQNLQKLVSFGHLDGFYYSPRIDRDILRKHAEGLIGLSACVSGHISRLVLNGEMDRARDTVSEYKSIFAPGKYFLELQPNGLDTQERVNEALAQLSRDCGVPIAATNDCHYVDRSEAEAHEVLMCMGQGRTLDDPKRMKHSCSEFYLKRPEEMQPYFQRYPEALENTCRIAQMCNVELELGKPELPDFRLPRGVEDDLPGYLRSIARRGLEQRLGEMRARGLRPDEHGYRERLEHELCIIIDMKFPGYFLIVWDFIKHAKENAIPVGPGRGSGAGSLVAYALRITDIDPIVYNLLFERFLNPERVSMPDFDIDFCMDRREEVIRYVTDVYGADHVGQIATFHSLKARGLVRDVCRVLGRSVAEASELAKLVPEGPKVTLSRALTDPKSLRHELEKNPDAAGKLGEVLAVAEASGKLRDRAANDPKAADVLRIGASLEGLNRHAGMHAAGIVISNRALWEHVPCFKADGKIVTQYTMTDVELAGLVKFDFLGLKTLTVIDTAVRLINAARPPEQHVDIMAIGMDDSGVYEMVSRGDTTGVFQLESSGFRDLLKRLRPDCFGDIIAAVALYRPGPLEGGMVDQFIECKHGRRAIVYPHALLDDVLAETYGVFVYQEQVMQAAQRLAGFSLGAADLMRRAMGKKKQSEMDQQRASFVSGCQQRDIADKHANEIFDLIDKFAGYGFNKSHSAAYGLITYQTAWLKHHYPVAFMAALMTCDKDKNENVVKFIAEARAMGIKVITPDVNESSRDFSVVRRPVQEGSDRHEELIRFGMGAVRNVGSAAVDAILDARADRGPFSSLFEFCRRVDLKRVNKRALEGLISSGAFDGIGSHRDRGTLLTALEEATEQGQAAQRDRYSGQRGLFDAMGGDEAVYVERYPTVEPWTAKQRLLAEREALGFYLTGHPLDRLQHDVDRFATTRIGELRKEQQGSEVILGGMICELREVQTKSGRGPMGIFQLEDQFGRIESIVFPKVYARVEEDTQLSLGDLLERIGDEPVLVTGRLEVDSDESGEAARFKLIVEAVREVARVRAERTSTVLLSIPAVELTEARILTLKGIVASNAGPCTMELRVTVDDRFVSTVVFGDKFGVTADENLLFSLEKLFGPGAARLV